MSRIVLITGASSGYGKATAKALYERRIELLKEEDSAKKLKEAEQNYAKKLEDIASKKSDLETQLRQYGMSDRQIALDELNQELASSLEGITNTDEILAKLLANDGKSDYDFIDLESAYVKPFVDNDLLEKLDYKNIPNSEALDESCWGVVGDEKNVWILPMTMYRLSVK